MIFTTFIYPFFLAIAAFIYHVSPPGSRWIWLLLASAAYYISFVPVFLLLLSAIIPLNFFMARWLARSKESGSGSALALIIILNILILAFFKYFNNLFPGNQIHLFTPDLFFRSGPVNKMILPLGLSYLIFTVLSYQIEVKRKNIAPSDHLGFFSLYLLFFPKIAQGPIERPQTLMPQLQQSHSFSYELSAEGLKQILWGYFKKLVVADRLAIYVNAVYGNNEHHNGTTLIVATVFFAFQIYADFSGYTDIALGSAKLFGIRLTDNFRQPYLATSIKDFWDRWHISFSYWLRDYLFTPLAFFLSHRADKAGFLIVPGRKMIYTIAIMITFAVCGIWHGVGWTYLAWGLMFGVFLSYSNSTRDFHKKIRKRLQATKISAFYTMFKVISTFIIVTLAWVFFRADSLTEAIDVTGKFFTSYGRVFYEKPTDLIFSISGIFALLAVDLKREYFNGRFSILFSRYQAVRLTGIVIIVLIILAAGVFDGGQFIYFKF